MSGDRGFVPSNDTIDARLKPPSQLHIQSHGLRSDGVRIILKGVDISDMVQSIKVEWAQGEAITATIAIMPNSVEIDTETLIHLAALAKLKVVPE